MEEELKAKIGIDSIRETEGKDFFKKNPDKLKIEHEELLSGLFLLIKEGQAKLRIKHKKKNNTWCAEIYMTATGDIQYQVDLPDEVQDFIIALLGNNFEPEYIEE